MRGAPPRFPTRFYTCREFQLAAPVLKGGTASIFLNGGNSSYTKVVGGRTPVNEPGNAVDFSNFTLDNVDKVEIVSRSERRRGRC